MRTLSSPDLLDLWERGGGLHPLDRALLALAFTLPEEPYDALAAWPLGKRNAALLHLRRASFGGVLSGWVACPHCGARLEFSLDSDMLAAERDQAAGLLSDTGAIRIHERSFRPLNSRDLASIAGHTDERAAMLELLRQCCTDGGACSDEELETIGDRLAEADPLAEILLDFACAVCEHRWGEPLDIGAWLWAEIDARARRLLHDVHTLATAYGWSEREILSFGERRRALYLEMVQA